MSRILPIFVPQLGCPHACVYCNQRAVSGAEAAPGEEQLDQEITRMDVGHRPAVPPAGEPGSQKGERET